MNSSEIFNLIKKQEFTKIYDLIKNDVITNLDIYDETYNYFIQYIINFNQNSILKLILEKVIKNEIIIRLDLLDTDDRSILYNCIKFNYIEMIKLLLEYDKKNIGVSIIDIKDKFGLTALHYSTIYNNYNAFKLLLENNANPYINSSDGNNVFIYCLMYERNNFLKYMFDKKYNINFTNYAGETLLQVAIIYENKEIVDLLLKTNVNINNTTTDYGLTALHMTIIRDNYDIFLNLIEKADLNLADFYGNTPLHHIIINNKIEYLSDIINKPNIRFNSSNINGEIPLHLLLESDFNQIDKVILDKFIIESDLNIQNNKGDTCLFIMAKKELLRDFKKLLVIKPLNFFIENNKGESVKINDETLDILINSYYNQLKISKDLLIDWEKWCSTDTFNKLKEIIKGYKTSEEICKVKIREVILKEKRSIPKVSSLKLVFDHGIFLNNCFYTGNPIDILFGLILLHETFNSYGMEVILDYPLSINHSLESYYKKVGLDYPFRLDFSNIEIYWIYQKIFYPSYFDNEIKKKMKTAKYIVIPLGIQTSVSNNGSGSHANILFWDVVNRTIERFEPHGANYPINLNYNPKLLDTILENKFKMFDPKIKYYAPPDFLPTIGFQMIENMEIKQCKIGDPNGFCGVWCVWWVYQRMLNIKNKKIIITSLADEIIKNLKFDNQSFKNIIRNFSTKITTIRDKYLSELNIDINDWVANNYNEEILDKLEKNIIKNIK